MSKENALPNASVDSIVLLPCPFCGEQAVEDNEEVGNQMKHWVCCSYCNAMVYSFTSEKRARQGWNIRRDFESLDKAAREFFAWFNRTYQTEPSNNPEHPWCKMGDLLNAQEGQ